MEKQTKDYTVYVLYALILAISALSYFLPVVPEAAHPEAHHWRMVFTLAMVTSFCGSAILFLRGLGAFKAGMRHAYTWFAVGMMLFGVALLQWPVVIMQGLTTSFWATSGLMILPSIFATAFMYIGINKFAKLLEVRSILTRLPILMTGVVFFAALSGIVHTLFATINVEGIETEAYTATVSWALGYGVLTWLLVIKVEHAIGAVYRRPMRWLKISMGVLAASGIHEYLTSFIVDESDWYIYSGASLWPFIITGFFLVWAGHSFNELTYVGQSEPAHSSDQNTDRAIIDSVTNTAGLASRPAEIDVLLDGLRQVTSSLQPGIPLSPNQRHTLAEVYQKIEHYLVTSDPIRSYTTDELRKNIDPALLALLDSKS